MEHASLENTRTGKFWEYDCLMICTLLGLSLSNKEIGDLCTKYGILSKEDAEDPALGFYALHHACHVEEGPVPRFLSRNFSLKYRAFRKALEEREEETVLNLTGLLSKPHPKALGGALWATLNDSRKSIQAQGIYGAHKIVLNALREYQSNLAEAEKEESAAAVSPGKNSPEKDAPDFPFREFEKLRHKCEELEKNLALQEERYANLERSAGEEKEMLKTSYEEKVSKLRRQIRLLEYSPREDVAERAGTSEKESSPCKNQGMPQFPCPLGKNAEKPSSSCPLERNFEVSSHSPDCPSRGCPFCMLSDTTVSIIGGLSRLEQQYREVVEKMGARCRYHCGNCQQGGKNLKQMIQSSDRVVFITSINSHNALRITKGICKKEGKPLHLLRETSPSALEKIFLSPESQENPSEATVF